MLIVILLILIDLQMTYASLVCIAFSFDNTTELISGTGSSNQAG